MNTEQITFYLGVEDGVGGGVGINFLSFQMQINDQL